MKLITPFLTGAAVLALANAALAAEPMVLDDVQLDHVTAGFANAGGSFSLGCVSDTCSAFGSGSSVGSVFDSNGTAFASAFQNLNVTNFSGTVGQSTSAFANVGID